MSDRLFLLKPGFEKGDGRLYYCPSCATIEGFLSFFPDLRHLVAVEYLPFPKPRRPIADLIGPDNQSLPVLILDAAGEDDIPDIQVKDFSGTRFINDGAEIRRYLSIRHGLPAAS
jgi:hypothetical protein